jgi:hypothetical protein
MKKQSILFLSILTIVYGGMAYAQSFGIISAVKSKIGELKQKIQSATPSPTASSANVILNFPSADPPMILSGRSTTIIVTVPLTSSVPFDVELTRFDSNNNIVGVYRMNDSGINGDSVAGDKIYTAQVVENVSSSTSINYQVAVPSLKLQKSLSVPIIYVIYPSNVTTFNQMMSNLCSQAVTLQAQLTSLKQQVQSKTVPTNYNLSTVNSCALTTFMSFEGVTNHDFFGILDVLFAGMKQSNTEQEFLNNPFTDPGTAWVGKALAKLSGDIDGNGNVIDYYNLYDDSEITPSNYMTASNQKWLSDMGRTYAFFNSSVNPNSPGVNLFNTAQNVLVKQIQEPFNDLTSDGLDDLLNGTAIGTVKDIYDVGETAYNGVNLIVDASGVQKIAIGQTANNESYEVPSGAIASYVGYPTNNKETILDNVAVPPGQTTIINYTSGAVATPIAPSLLTAVAASDSQINLTWTNNSNVEVGFIVQRAPVGGSFTSIVTVGSSATNFSDTGLSQATTYSYQVMAFNSVGNSGFSNISTVMTGGQPTLPLGSPKWKALTNQATSSSPALSSGLIYGRVKFKGVKGSGRNMVFVHDTISLL